jgi:hypothetical protein
MAQRPSFDMSRVSTADRIIIGGALLLFIDTFLAWQRLCIGSICDGNRIAWNGDGAFAGVLMGFFAILLIAGQVTMATGGSLPVTIPMSTVMAGLTVGTLLFGLIKFLLVVPNHAKYGAWIGLILLLAIAYGGYMKMQEQKAIPPAPGFDQRTGP